MRCFVVVADYRAHVPKEHATTLVSRIVPTDTKDADALNTCSFNQVLMLPRILFIANNITNCRQKT